MVKTAAKKETVDKHARVLIQHHAQVCMREGLLTEPPVPAHQQYPKSWPNSPERFQATTRTERFRTQARTLPTTMSRRTTNRVNRRVN